MVIIQVVQDPHVAVHVILIVQIVQAIQVVDVPEPRVVLLVQPTAVIHLIIREAAQALLVAPIVALTVEQAVTKRVQETALIIVETDVHQVAEKVVLQLVKQDVVANVTGLVEALVINNALLDA
ncbi:MAG: hypothetical protein NC356_00230 [Ruminococcus sp.]|nr:hypothetical protein [Ruminococcus sp.]